MNLIIVESPTKARTLSRFLGKEYSILPTMGHIRDLPKDKLGIDVDKDFEPIYVPVKGRKDTVKQLKDEAKKAEVVFLATDPDREGEAIAWHVAHLIGEKSKGKTQKLNLKRIVFHEITQSAIKEAVAHPRDIDMQLVDAQQARRVLDRLVGYKLSPLLWYKVRKGLSAGRVQSVAVRLIVERERDIEAFKPVEYWLIEALLAKEGKGNREQGTEKITSTFTARLIEKEGKKIDVNNKLDADTIVADLEKANYVVGEVKKKESKRNPYAPFTTSTMQQTASNRFGWSAKKSMQLAQALYEEGLITYHRTDSTNIAAEALPPLREFISTVYGPAYVPESPRLYKTKSKVAQEAHEAIRPTNSRVVSPNDAKVVAGAQLEHKILPDHVGRDAERLYSLIWRRFVASQMTEALFDQTSVDIKASIYTLRANGSVVKFDGWQKLYNEDQKAKSKDQKEQSTLNDSASEEDGEAADKRLPALEEGEQLNLEKLLPQQKFTEPPPRFNEASLIKALEERGIGRPSTYAPTISTIQDRQYVEKREKRFYPTSLGSAVNDFLVKNFANVIDYDFTAKMEDQLDNIANGEAQWVPTIREFFTPFNDRISVVYKEADRVKIVTEQIDELCPTCNNPLVVRLGKFGKFIACSTYPACKYTRQFVEKTGIACPKCGGDIIARKTKHGKQFYGCGNYPNCDFAAWKKEDIEKKAAEIGAAPSTETVTSKP